MRSTDPSQLPLALPVDAKQHEAAVLEKAAELFERSRFLRRKYGRLETLLADPVAGRCLRLSATQLIRLAGLGSEKRSR